MRAVAAIPLDSIQISITKFDVVMEADKVLFKRISIVGGQVEGSSRRDLPWGLQYSVGLATRCSRTMELPF